MYLTNNLAALLINNDDSGAHCLALKASTPSWRMSTGARGCFLYSLVGYRCFGKK